jgi:hypothetical protein
MQAEITDHDRLTMLRLSVAKVDSADIRAALGTLSGQLAQLPKAVGNALNALRKHRDPIGVVGRAQYRPALPYVAAAIADPCLTRTIEVLGEHSDDPTREQLVAALDAIGDSFSDVTVAVMLASVADGEMPASDLCFDILANDERYGLTDWSEQAEMPAKAAPSPRESHAATPEQREARRSKRQEAANERRRRMEASRQAAEQVRRSKKKDRSPGAGTTGSAAREARTSEKRGPRASSGGRRSPPPRRRSSTAPIRGWPAWSLPGCRSTRSIPTFRTSTASRAAAWWLRGPAPTCWSDPGTPRAG